MSWKNIVITGLLCVVASPAFADPTLATMDVARFAAGPNAGRLELNASGNISWIVKVDPDDAAVTAGNGSIAAEIAFTATGASVVSATKNADWDRDNKGVAPAGFAFWTPTSEGVVTNGSNVMSALGSINFATGSVKDYATIVTQGPLYIAAGNVNNRTTIALQAYGGYAGSGRLAQNADNFDNVNQTLSKTFLPGDSNFDGDVNLLDLATLGANYNTLGTQTWAGGNYNGTGVGLTNLAILGAFYNVAPITAPGGGSLAAVPEPASFVLVALSLLGVAGLRRRSMS